MPAVFSFKPLGGSQRLWGALKVWGLKDRRMGSQPSKYAGLKDRPSLQALNSPKQLRASIAVSTQGGVPIIVLGVGAIARKVPDCMNLASNRESWAEQEFQRIRGLNIDSR